MQTIEFKILDQDDIPQIEKFEDGRHQAKFQEPAEAELAKWNVPWRKESLLYYAEKGWSFVARHGDANRGDLVGFHLGQVIPFFRNQTQVLWVEYISLDPKSDLNVLAPKFIDMIRRYGREKHLQSACIDAKSLMLLQDGVREKIIQACLEVGAKGDGHIIEISTSKSIPGGG